MNETTLHGQNCLRVRIADILIEERADKLLLSACVEIVRHSFILLHQSLMRPLEKGGARAIRYQPLTLVLVVLGRLLQQHPLELLLVQLARVFAHLDQHLDGGSDLGFFDDFALTFLLDLFDEELDEALLNPRIHDDMVLELAILHVLDQRQIELRHKIFVHVQ